MYQEKKKKNELRIYRLYDWFEMYSSLNGKDNII